MIQTLIIAMPGVAALIVCIRRGPERAFLDVYLPVLLLLPQSYFWPISGQLSFSDTAILPIGLFILYRSKWHWNTIDLLIIAYMAITIIAEGMNKGYKLGSQNIASHELCSILLPYVAAKRVFQFPSLAVEAGKRIVLSLAIVSILSVYEFRMGSDLFTRMFAGIFPPLGNTVVFRSGFMRTQGPYGHAIALGIVMAIGFRVARWLEWTGSWKNHFRFLPISTIRLCELWIVAGSIMSLSVGPWLGTLCGVAIVSVCRARNRRLAIASLIVAVILVAGPINSRFEKFISADPQIKTGTIDQLQEDSAYRSQMIQLYIPLIEERPNWGWGINEVPALSGITSIDNDYILTAVVFGVYALLFKVALLVWPLVRLPIISFPLRPDDPRASAAFSLMGIYVLLLFVLGTVSFGSTDGLLFILISGWSAALLGTPGYKVREVEPTVLQPTTKLAFKRVMV